MSVAHHPIIDLAADIGLTAHIGGTVTTDLLAARCGVRPNHRLLEVGCGIGTTAAHLGRTIGCRITAVDAHPRMVELARRTIVAAGMAGDVEVVHADARRLPWPDDTFDTTVSEHMLMFADDKAEVLTEMVRVTRPGGTVGVNEPTILARPLPGRIETYLSETVEGVDFEDEDSWTALLRGAGLCNVTSEPRPVRFRDELTAVRSAGMRSYASMALRMAQIWRREPHRRALVKRNLVVPRHISDYLGTGIYVGDVG